MVRTTYISMTDVYSRHYISQFFLVQFVPIHLNTRYLTRAYLQVFLKKNSLKAKAKEFWIKAEEKPEEFLKSLNKE